MESWLAVTANRKPTAPALMLEGQRWSYRDLYGMVIYLTSLLLKQGVTAGDRVAVLLPNSLEYVCLIHALNNLGAVLVPLNTRLTAEEVAWQVRHVAASLVVVDRTTHDKITALDIPLLFILALEAQPGSDAEYRPPDLDALQSIMFTSGTSGQPKGVMLTYNNFLWSAMGSAYHLGTLPHDRWLCCLPLYHIGGLSIVFRCALYGTTLVLHQGFDVAKIADSMQQGQITQISLVPTQLYRLLEAGVRFPESVRVILLGGAAAPLELLERCRALNLPLAPTYGLTEACSQVATLSPQMVYQKMGSVGRGGLPFTTVSLKPSTELQAYDTGGQELGEIVVGGQTVMQGYYKNPTATEKALQQGQLHTGDIGYYDEDGYLYVVQRRTDLIVSGGENVYPAEVERTLSQHPAVLSACVVGVSDLEWGQKVAAAIILKPDMHTDADEIIQFARRTLAGYKVPRQIIFVGEFPLTASGKIQRHKVADLFHA